jgi:hypothetical protein
MIEVIVTPDMVAKAKEKAKEMGLINNSILKGSGSVAGFIGEQVVQQVVGGEWDNTYEYDLISALNNKIEVKTKQTSRKPLPYYECSVAKFNTRQLCDYYAFVRVNYDQTLAWYLGAMQRAEYYSKATFFSKGEVDPDNNFIVKADMYNLPISELKEYTV